MGFQETFKALSDPVRRDILVLLRDGRMSAGDIGSHFDMTGATMSYHFKQLKNADLITETKEKNFVYYELNTSVFDELVMWLEMMKGKKNEKTDMGHSPVPTDSDGSSG
ncbi:autorepressor SdpR family transcription factor [Ruminococcus albus]|uniref:Helix-turn-helix domain-containing protein n=1 Tax=Ruminococcus albus TaxID=1264 RepID=A0A1I1N5C5_RUMAL|nr:autorepressor SdpR family transcription factor [Ruminococcus albus]SFC88950.1 Helix-turn-helix domain-containing protein [Ruminococcus albus]